MVPMVLSLGYGAPTSANICPTEQMYFSTVFLDRLVVGLKDACADLVSEDL